MHTDPRQQIPSVTMMLEQDSIQRLAETHGREFIVGMLQSALDQLRRGFGNTAEVAQTRDQLIQRVSSNVEGELNDLLGLRPHPVVNATGILLHTGLGRAPLSDDAIAAVADASRSCLLEVDPMTGDRRYRGFQVDHLLRLLTGAPSSLVVNNNAAATLLVLKSLCANREVILSRGQLVEIGGSFRLPEIFEQAGVRLREVGTTNRTHIEDYAAAVNERTAAIMRVHASNYRIVGFTSEPDTRELSRLAQAHNLLMIDDIGSGLPAPMLMEATRDEPDFRTSVESGADVVLGSADKLLGGPQAGLIVGRTDLISQLKRQPLARCLRIDKLNLAALHATLQQHANGSAARRIPFYQMLSASTQSLTERAERIIGQLGEHAPGCIHHSPTVAQVGGGSCAGVSLPSVSIVLTMQQMSAENALRRLRQGRPAVWGRIQDEQIWLDLRSVLPADDQQLTEALSSLFHNSDTATH
ncbi:MAG: L-seryl-tRNA(Sec) selenium transferase [Planctomycetaceae bacterium]|nr:L-seryl-tRNA(Sec) selenium transferase [Planctomycetaceae bacterium]